MKVKVDDPNLPVTKIIVHHLGNGMCVKVMLSNPYGENFPENRMNITISDVYELNVIKGTMETLHERMYSDKWREVHHD